MSKESFCGFVTNHPELREGEVWIANMYESDEKFDDIPFGSKRKGEIPWSGGFDRPLREVDAILRDSFKGENTDSGSLYRGLVPIFALKAEIESMNILVHREDMEHYSLCMMPDYDDETF